MASLKAKTLWLGMAATDDQVAIHKTDSIGDVSAQNVSLRLSTVPYIKSPTVRRESPKNDEIFKEVMLRREPATAMETEHEHMLCVKALTEAEE